MSNPKNAVPATAGAAAKSKKKSSDIDPEDAEFDGFMSDVEADLRSDEFKKLWARYGNSIIALVIVFLASVTGYQLYQQYIAREHEAAGRRYELAVTAKQDGRVDEALKEFTAIAQENPRGYGALARLSEAALRVEKKDIAGAVENYKALAADQKADPALRDLATVLYVLHSLDREDPKTLETALTPITNPDNAFSLSALELQALLAAKQGDNARAVKTLEQITSDPATPSSMRARAEDLSKLYGAGVMPPPPAVPAVPPAPATTPPAAAPSAAKP